VVLDDADAGVQLGEAADKPEEEPALRTGVEDVHALFEEEESLGRRLLLLENVRDGSGCLRWKRGVVCRGGVLGGGVGCLAVC